MTVNVHCRWIPDQNRDAVNRLDLPSDERCAHPAKIEKAQPVEVTPFTNYMVPKPGFEPGQAYTH